MINWILYNTKSHCAESFSDDEYNEDELSKVISEAAQRQGTDCTVLVRVAGDANIQFHRLEFLEPRVVLSKEFELQ